MRPSSNTFKREFPVNLSAKDVELFEDEAENSTRDSVPRSLGSVRVSSDSVVYRGIRLVAETVVARDQVPYYRVKHLAKKLFTAKKVTLDLARKYLLATDAWSTGHFHWFTEVLPKLLSIESIASEFILLLPDTPYLRTIGTECLALLGIEFEDIVWMRESEFYNAPDLYYLTRIAAPGQMNDDIMKELNRRFRRDTGPATKRFYISRSEARVRKVLNERVLESTLSDHGFETVRPENLSLSEQIDLFAKCSTLVGIHGAGLTNCLFMPPGGTVVELRKREPNYAYWHLADSVGHKYFYYHGEPDSEQSLIGSGCNLTIDVKEFESQVLSALETKRPA